MTRLRIVFTTLFLAACGLQLHAATNCSTATLGNYEPTVVNRCTTYTPAGSSFTDSWQAPYSCVTTAGSANPGVTTFSGTLTVSGTGACGYPSKSCTPFVTNNNGVGYAGSVPGKNYAYLTVVNYVVTTILQIPTCGTGTVTTWYGYCAATGCVSCAELRVPQELPEDRDPRLGVEGRIAASRTRS
jgi:hypothetical protein